MKVSSSRLPSQFRKYLTQEPFLVRHFPCRLSAKANEMQFSIPQI